MPDDKNKIMTTDAGRPVGDNQNSLTVGPRGPVVFEDFLLYEKMAHFNRERIPERVVHGKGSGAYGDFVRSVVRRVGGGCGAMGERTLDMSQECEPQGE